MTVRKPSSGRWQPDGSAALLTLRLAGSLPPKHPFRGKKIAAGRGFVEMDRALGRAAAGPAYFKDGGVAILAADSIRRGELLNNYELHAWVVMPNHLHVLLTPFVRVPRMVRFLQSSSAIAANGLLGRDNRPFWEPGFHRHDVRNDDEFRRIAAYIVNDPVQSGLCRHPEEWIWSSAGGGIAHGGSRDTLAIPCDTLFSSSF